MNDKRIKWKFLFFILIGLVGTSIYDAVTIPEIIAPTHPSLLSIGIFVIDIIMLLGAYNYSFKKRIIIERYVWTLSIYLFFIFNIMVLGFEFYNRSDGYEIDEMVLVVAIKIFIIFFISYPAYLYNTVDLKLSINDSNDNQ